MIPIIALIGRPNVGKSTLFNTLTFTQDALVSKIPELTRDRKYGCYEIKKQKFIIIDTGGINDKKNIFNIQIQHQSLRAIQEANIILFLLDGQTGLLEYDKIIANNLRYNDKKVFLLINKTENIKKNKEILLNEFFILGLGKAYNISAAHNLGINEFFIKILLPWIKKSKFINDKINNTNLYKYYSILKYRNTLEKFFTKIAIVGNSNVGKSTLVNSFIKENRMIVFNEPGTTRESIAIPLKTKDHINIFIDTAGLKKRSKILYNIENISHIKTLKSIKQANIVILLININNNKIIRSDISLLQWILKNGKAVVIAINKWDKIKEKKNKKNIILNQLKRVNFIPVYFISALYNTGIKKLFNSILKIKENFFKFSNTSFINRILRNAIEKTEPPFLGKNKKKIILKYAHIGGYFPPTIIIHGNKVSFLPNSYKKYLINYFQKTLKIVGNQIRILFKNNKNPYNH